MQQKNIWDFIHFGTVFRFLQDAEEGWSIHKKNCVLDNLSWFFEFLETHSFNITLKAAYKLREIQNELENAEKDSRLTHAQKENLVEEIVFLRRVIQAEGQGIITFLTREKRYRNESLLYSPEKLFPEDCFEKLPPFSQDDFSEAGKCIAFERPTAAVFHLLRGTEGVLKILYFGYFKRKRIKILMWGPMEEALTNKTGKKPVQELLDQLKIIRRNFRNPTAYPEKFYSLDEAQNLLGQSIDLITRMVEDEKYSLENK